MPEPERPYVAFRDRPACPVCGMQDDVVSPGQYATGESLWHCCHCEHDWKILRGLVAPAKNEGAEHA